MKVIAITNQKGGEGKTTTAISLGAALAHAGHKVLFIDLDPQRSLTYLLRGVEDNYSAYELLKGEATIKEVIQSVAIGDLIASTPFLSRAVTEFQDVGREYKLADALQQVRDIYSYVIVDTPPALSVLTINALTAANDLIIPAQADILSLHGITQLVQTIDTVKRHTNRDLNVRGVLLTRHNSRTNVSKDLTDVLSDTAQKLGTTAFKTVIRETASIHEAHALRTDIFTHAPKSNGANDYREFVNEYLSSEV